MASNPDVEGKELSPSTSLYRDSGRATPTPDAGEQTTAPTTPSDAKTTPKPPAASKYRGIIFFFILFAYFLFSFDIPLMANIRPKIIDDLGEIDKLPILSVVYSLALTGTNLVWAFNYRTFNFRILFCFSVLVFMAGSAVCGAAPNMNALIVGRALCGLGGGGMYIGTLTYVVLATTPQERPKWMSIIGVAYAIGAILGPVIGGAFADASVGWRWAFYFCLFVGAVGAPTYLFALPNFDPRRGESFLTRIKRFDFLGYALFLGLLVCWTLFPSFGGSIWAWSDGRTIATIVVSAVCAVAFIIQQYFCLLTTPDERIFPGALLRKWEMWILFAQMACAMTALYIPLYFLPLNFQFVRGDSALLAGAKVVPLLAIGCIALMLSGALMGRIPVYMPYYLIGSAFVLGGGVMMHSDTYDRPAGYLIGASVLVGVQGLFNQLSFPVAQAKVAPAQIAAATAFIGFAQVSSVDVVLVISNSIFLNQAADKIQAVLPAVSRHRIYGAISGSSSALFDSLPPAVRVDVQKQILATCNEVYVLVIVAGALGVLMSLFMKRERLGGKPAPKAEPQNAPEAKV